MSCRGAAHTARCLPAAAGPLSGAHCRGRLGLRGCVLTCDKNDGDAHEGPAAAPAAVTPPAASRARGPSAVSAVAGVGCLLVAPSLAAARRPLPRAPVPGTRPSQSPQTAPREPGGGGGSALPGLCSSGRSRAELSQNCARIRRLHFTPVRCPPTLLGPGATLEAPQPCSGGSAPGGPHPAAGGR